MNQQADRASTGADRSTTSGRPDRSAEGSPPTFDAAAKAAELLGPLAATEASLAPYCTYRVGGPAAVLVQVESIDELATVGQAVVATGLPTLMVGKGSNLLVSDAGFPGIAVHLGEGFAGIEIGTVGQTSGLGEQGQAERTVTVTAGGSALLPVVARKTASAGLTGFEWAVGVPGSVGGAVRMNAGGHGSDMAAGLAHAEVFDLLSPEAGVQRWALDRLDLGYRHSALGPRHVVVSAQLALVPGDTEAALEEISEIVRWRRQNQPGGQNAGSVFANPPGDSAGRLIDDLGLKGFRIGTAEVSTKHANFIQADPDGSADDVFALIRELQLRVAAAAGIELRVENRLIGFEDRGFENRGPEDRGPEDRSVENGDGG